MSLLEWICESYDPGPIGNVSTHENRRKRTRLSAMGTGVLALGALAFPFVAAYQSSDFTPSLWVWIAGGLGAYLMVAYRLRPNPNYSNLGCLGGLVDHPFRYSDDINRFLVFLVIVLAPGRLVAIGLVDFFRAFRHPSVQ